MKHAKFTSRALATCSVLAATAVSLLALRSLSLPYLWSGAAWLAALVLALLGVAGAARKAVLSLVAILLVFLPLETAAWIRQRITKPELIIESAHTYNMPHPILGYAPHANQVARARRVGLLFTVYDVTYTINEHRLRATPSSSSQASSSVLFFGGSFTFGEGLEDQEALPNQVAAKSGGELACYNFGCHGYGPHQMLAALRGGMVQDIVTQPPRCVIYQAIGAHVHRAAGYAPWSRAQASLGFPGDPRFVVEGGQVVQRGTFPEPKPATGPWAKIRNQLDKSFLLRRLFPRKDKYLDTFTDEEISACGAIVGSAADYCQAHLPDASFHVILWDLARGAPGDVTRRLHDVLRQRGLRVHLISDIIPDVTRAAPGVYQIERDNHPTAKANKLISEYLFAAGVLKFKDA